MLASRLKRFLTNYINKEQAGFLPKHQIKDNLRFLMNAIEYYDKNPDKKVRVFFVDTEKAFDNVNWIFFLRQWKEWVWEKSL